MVSKSKSIFVYFNPPRVHKIIIVISSGFVVAYAATANNANRGRWWLSESKTKWPAGPRYRTATTSIKPCPVRISIENRPAEYRRLCTTDAPLI